MKFLQDFEKTVSKMDGIATSAKPPLYWFSSGNYVLNRIISGSFFKAIPQGRIVGLAGPSGAGKSFMCGNFVKHAQEEGAFIIVLDSENALDDNFMTKIGVDVEKNYLYYGVSTVNQVVEIVSAFLQGYEKDYGKFNEEAPKVLFVLDSLDMLLTDSEEKNFVAGKQKGDQGQKSKQNKTMLKNIVNGIKAHNISMLVTSQVYQNQDLLNGEGLWIVNNAIRYALSLNVLLTKQKLKGENKEIDGINMKCEGHKTRFTKPHQKVTVEVPYESGMNPYSGLLEVLQSIGIVERKGAWYSCPELNIKFQSKNLEEHADKLIELAESVEKVFIDSTKLVEAEDDMDTETVEETNERRRKKATS